MPEQDTIFEGALIINGFFPEDHLWNELINLLKEIEDLPQPIPWNGLCAWDINLSIHRKTRNGNICQPLEWGLSALDQPNACAAITFKCKPSAKHPEQNKDFKDFAECYFNDFAHAFIYAANIARPGCLSVISILTRLPNGSYKEKNGINHELTGAVDYSKKTGWPALTPVAFGHVWVWVLQNAFHIRSGDTPLSRAFNAYTWLFEKKSDFPFGLVSALIGIEALFTNTTSGITEQVRRRAQLLLGNRTTFKNDLDKMYAARSAFIHGSKMLHPNGFSWMPSEEIECKIEKLSDAEDIASAVLLSSLQRLVEKRWTSLEFPENIIGSDKIDYKSIEDNVKGIAIPCAYESEIKEWMDKFIRRFD